MHHYSLTKFNDCMNNALISLTHIHLSQSENVALQLISCKRKIGCDSAGSYCFLQCSTDANLRPLVTGWMVKFHIFAPGFEFALLCSLANATFKRLQGLSRTFHPGLAFSSSSDWFLGLFGPRVWHFPPLLTIDLRFRWVLIGLLFHLAYATFAVLVTRDLGFL